MAVSGGTDRVTYYVSGNGSTTDGYLPTGNSKEGGFRGNFTFSPTEKLRFTLNTTYQRRDTRWVNDGPELSYSPVRYTKYDPMERTY